MAWRPDVEEPAARPSAGLTAPLPADAVLLHVGLHKTGTTVLQGALHRCRGELAKLDVLYPGSGTRSHHHWEAVSLQQTSRVEWVPPERRPYERWDALVNTIHHHRGRAVISSEFFAHCLGEHAAKVVADLGAGRVHLLLATRNLGELLPSSWQQYLKGGYRIGYEDWLSEVLAPDPAPDVTPTFWLRNDLRSQLDRWLPLIAADRIHVVVLDPADRTLLLRSCAALLGVPVELLDVETDRTNRSMTAPEAELVRQTNVGIEGIDRAVFWKQYSFGGIRAMVDQRAPAGAEPVIGLPEWAARRAQEIGSQHVAALRGASVDIIGDVTDLERPTPARPVMTVSDIPIAAAAAALAGTLWAAERVAAEQAQVQRAAAERAAADLASAVEATRRAHALSRADGAELARELLRRLRRRLTGIFGARRSDRGGGRTAD